MLPEEIIRAIEMEKSKRKKLDVLCQSFFDFCVKRENKGEVYIIPDGKGNTSINGIDEKVFEAFLGFHAALVPLSKMLNIIIRPIDIKTGFNYTSSVIYSNFLQAKRDVLKIRYEDLIEEYSYVFDSQYCIEFTDAETTRVQDLLNELRAIISVHPKFDEDHRARLLARLERLQSELHKKVSDIDKFWALMGEAGVAMKKFGEDAKPIVDRIREILEIGWRSQARAEQLPTASSFPQIEPPQSGEA